MGEKQLPSASHEQARVPRALASVIKPLALDALAVLGHAVLIRRESRLASRKVTPREIEGRVFQRDRGLQQIAGWRDVAGVLGPGAQALGRAGAQSSTTTGEHDNYVWSVEIPLRQAVAGDFSSFAIT
jgi:hypothetical protein